MTTAERYLIFINLLIFVFVLIANIHIQRLYQQKNTDLEMRVYYLEDLVLELFTVGQKDNFVEFNLDSDL